MYIYRYLEDKSAYDMVILAHNFQLQIHENVHLWQLVYFVHIAKMLGVRSLIMKTKDFSIKKDVKLYQIECQPLQFIISIYIYGPFGISLQNL